MPQLPPPTEFRTSSSFPLRRSPRPSVALLNGVALRPGWLAFKSTLAASCLLHGNSLTVRDELLPPRLLQPLSPHPCPLPSARCKISSIALIKLLPFLNIPPYLPLPLPQYYRHTLASLLYPPQLPLLFPSPRQRPLKFIRHLFANISLRLTIARRLKAKATNATVPAPARLVHAPPRRTTELSLASYLTALSLPPPFYKFVAYSVLSIPIDIDNTRFFRSAASLCGLNPLEKGDKVREECSLLLRTAHGVIRSINYHCS